VGPAGFDAVDEYLRSLGATQEQIEIARRQCRLAGLASDMVLARGIRLSATDVAERENLDVDRVIRLWHTLGVAPPDKDQPFFTEADAQYTAVALGLEPFDPDGNELFRVLGSSLASVAETAVSLYVQTVEPEMDRPDVDVLVWAQSLAHTTEMALKLGDAMGLIFAHHMRAAIDRQRASMVSVPERYLSRLAVGFVDLVGFTPLSHRTSGPELLDLISRFETRAFEAATAHGGRVVKHIGDEVMFVALDAADGCAIAQALTHAAGDDGIEPRGGVAFGDVITRYGDYFGSVVNLAARLAELAIPGEILVSESTVDALSDDPFAFRPAGRRLLKGFDEPLEVFALHNDEG
jgi:adenylate cyclase